MIRRPRKKFGGALGEAFAELWEAVEAGQIVESDSMTVDKTTRGTVVRARGGGDATGGIEFGLEEDLCSIGDCPLMVGLNPNGNAPVGTTMYEYGTISSFQLEDDNGEAYIAPAAGNQVFIIRVEEAKVYNSVLTFCTFSVSDGQASVDAPTRAGLFLGEFDADILAGGDYFLASTQSMNLYQFVNIDFLSGVAGINSNSFGDSVQFRIPCYFFIKKVKTP